ncbi:hypothetical protein [Endozoicomonas sp.]|uniref:hypothetical protein n=1 Tax=Endozoicomonas sp. TaxID=1892382 RepID=UPI003AF580FA
METVLYFDIDGVLLNYDDEPKTMLLDGRLQTRLKALNLDRLVCVSGWSDIVNSDVPPKPQSIQKERIYDLLKAIFTDRAWFLYRLQLQYNTDQRCQYINLTGNWFYMDDWADQFFTDAYGSKAYSQHLGQRVLLVDPHAAGEDILSWLDTRVASLCKYPGTG